MKGRFLWLLFAAGEAPAHVGGAVSKAQFTNPPSPQVLSNDGGLALAPYTFAAADAQLEVTWTVDQPADPTGKFDFYYLDYMPPSGITYDQIITLGTPIPEASGDNGYWVSCSCDADAGVTCPDAGPRTHCEQVQFTWNTQSVAAGAYWIIAANFDYPYKIYTVSPGPVRVAHAAPLPPAAVIVLPDGLFAADKSYTTQWLATGQPPLHFDVFYGLNSQPGVLAPPTLLAEDITPIVNGDGSFSYVWDVSTLANGYYYFAVKVTDASGQSTVTRSQLGENVFHPPPDDGGFIILRDAAPDLAQPVMMGDGGCGCEVAGTSTVPLLALLALVLWMRRHA